MAAGISAPWAAGSKQAWVTVAAQTCSSGLVELELSRSLLTLHCHAAADFPRGNRDRRLCWK